MHSHSKLISGQCDKGSKTSIQHIVRHLKLHAHCTKTQVTKTLDENNWWVTTTKVLQPAMLLCRSLHGTKRTFYFTGMWSSVGTGSHDQIYTLNSLFNASLCIYKLATITSMMLLHDITVSESKHCKQKQTQALQISSVTSQHTSMLYNIPCVPLNCSSCTAQLCYNRQQ